jgi:6-pyruvoyl-tetrahydropterin synthase
MTDFLNTGSITLEDKDYDALLQVVRYVLENEENSYEECGRQHGHIYQYAVQLEFAIRK